MSWICKRQYEQLFQIDSPGLAIKATAVAGFAPNAVQESGE